jgi:hypothetical protein
MRTPLRRRILVSLLVGYSALVALAAWRHEIRPAIGDAPAAGARAALRAVGIPPGIAVFTAEVATPSDSKIRAVCLEARAFAADGRFHVLHPRPNAPCPEPAPRVWVRSEEIALYRFVTSLRNAVVAHRAGALRASQRRHPELLARSIAAHFRSRAESLGLAPTRYALLWRESRIDYRSGEASERVTALLRWDADPDRGVALAWRPDPEHLSKHWGTP